MGFDADDFHRRNKYDLNSKIMISAIISLSVVVCVVVFLHLYARCVLRRQARQRRAALQLNLVASAAQAHSDEPPKRGLEPSIIAALPVFLFKSDDGAKEECSVCLSVFEDGEMARTLPNCKHSFHAECIDKWFGSNSTCPVCRTEAEPREPREGIVSRTPPTAPPLEGANFSTNMEGTSSSPSAKIGGSNSRLSSFRRMLSREKSSTRIQVQSCGVEDGINDVERQ